MIKLLAFCNSPSRKLRSNFKDGIFSIKKSFSSKKSAPTSKAPPRIIVPKNCKEVPGPIASIDCRVALIIGGTDNGFGFSAADQLLSRGARKVILADHDVATGTFAAERLCGAYGKDRAKFFPCDPKNSCHVEAMFKSSIGRDANVSIVFNDLDAINRRSDLPVDRYGEEKNISKALHLTRLGLEHLSTANSFAASDKKMSARKGVIINCASVVGFTSWPRCPKPVYCHPEAAIEDTLKLAKEFPEERTGMRLIVLCPANRTYDQIGLPDNDDDKSEAKEPEDCEETYCSPDPTRDRGRMGRALEHVLGYAENGSAWLIEAPYASHEIPRLVRLGDPKAEGKSTLLLSDSDRQKELCSPYFDSSRINSPPNPPSDVRCKPVKRKTCYDSSN